MENQKNEKPFGQIQNGFYKVFIAGIDTPHYHSVKGSRSLSVWPREDIESVNLGWHFDFFKAKSVEQISEKEFHEAFQKCGASWESFI